MITLTKKYRLIWEWITLNIHDEPDKDYTGSVTMLTADSNRTGCFESDVYQDILDKIENEQLRTPENHLDFYQDDI